ncbi:PEBP-like protein, partial [Aeromonas veronii]|nr:PEBP-like protein [Aeromonas veronii]
MALDRTVLVFILALVTLGEVNGLRSFWRGKRFHPDAPSRSNPEMRSWKHWVVGNVPGTQLDQGTVLADYVGSGPPQGTGLHRYVFLVYQQPANLTFDETVLSSRNPNRGKWSPEAFAIKYQLGDPIAGNFY